MNGESAISNQKQKLALCVAIPREGKPIRQEAESPLEFLQLIKDSELAWVNCPIKDVAHNVTYIATMFGFNSTLVDALVADLDNFSSYIDQETQLGLMLPSIKVKCLEVEFHPLFILIRQGLVITIHEQDEAPLIRFARYADIFMRKIKNTLAWNDKITVLLSRIIDENNEINFDGLQTIQRHAINIDQDLIDNKMPRVDIARKIYEMKKSLILYLNMLWSTLNVINSLRYGDADTISDSQRLLSQIVLLGNDVTRQISISESLSNVLTGGLEVMQTIHTTQLQEMSNRFSFVLTWLTILGTAILIPNTLATVFGIPAISDAIGGESNYVLISSVLVISTIIASWVAYFFVRRKKWLPQELE